MSAVTNSESEWAYQTGPSRWPSTRSAGKVISPTSWLLGASAPRADEVSELRERLDDAERRAADAEQALPHLLALGQRTVNSLLTDARERSRRIIDEARQQAATEIRTERELLAKESTELDALRMAVAAEAMGLEMVREELEAAVAALQLPAPGVVSSPLEAPTVPDPSLRLLPPPPSVEDLTAVGMVPANDTTEVVEPVAEADAEPSAARRRSSRFSDVWADGEDDGMAEAFDRFFNAEASTDRHRDAVLHADGKAPWT